MKKDTDMKKIKSKLVTIVTDNVLGIGIVENKTLLAAHVAGKGGKAASREENKNVAMRR